MSVNLPASAKDDASDTVVAMTPGLEPLFILTADLGSPIEIGASPSGRRRIIPILTGTFEGDAIRGALLPGGADWQVLRSDFVTELHAHYLLQTDDGVIIQVKVRGLRHGPEEVLARVSAGKPVDPSEYYFRAAPIFEAPTGPYDWLNYSLFVSFGERYQSAVRLHFFRVS